MTSTETSHAVDDYQFLFETVFEEVTIGLAHVNLQGEVLRINNTLCDMLGYSREELLSMDLEEISHPEDYEKEKEHLKDITNGEIEQYSMKKRYIKEDLSTIWGDIRVKLIRDEDGKPKFLFGVVEDISEQIQAKRESEKLSAIVEVQQDVVLAELDIDETINRVAYSAMMVTEADGATVETLEDDELIYRGSCGNLEDNAGLRLPLDPTISGQCYRQGTLFNCHDTKTDERVKMSEKAVEIGFRSGIVVPLTYKEKKFGVLKVVSEKPYYFQEDDEQTLRLLSGLLASQIYHSMQYEDTLLRSKTDELTGLNNRRQLMEDMHDEIERASRYDHKLSLIMIDIDRFKLINDTHGHVIGDEVLRKIGNILSEETRTIDVVGRYGGEEFIILTPEIEVSEAVNLAERIREKMAETQFSGKEDETFTVTVSAGISGYEKSDSANKLIDQADQALYQAKRNGRDRVRVFEKNRDS